jgi:hypothetical protein
MARKKKTVAVAKVEPAKPLIESREDADEKIARGEAQISTYVSELFKVSNAEGLFGPKIEAITDLNLKIGKCIENRDALIKAKAELKD